MSSQAARESRRLLQKKKCETPAWRPLGNEILEIRIEEKDIKGKPRLM
ncbi:Hypothetical protein Minf_0004 [Methylacidiphilum infernorum V4]|uniref:Uncharacterized protein n=1 Tax=Methylacidiphilum infernorum (isolate V4) TaxID=481448 RepID=B3DWG9_METI4|nr:Hypothetical protein Minf_0004 [Methylacidiphilum infernorum V4]